MSDLKKTVEIVFEGKDKLSTGLSRMRAGFGKFTSSLAPAVKALGVFAAATAAAAAAGAYIVKEELEKADTIAKTADMIGISTDALQEWTWIADRAGVSSTVMSTGLTAFTKRLGEAQSGTGSLNGYLKKYDEQLLKNLTSTNSTSEALDMFMKYLAGVESQSEKAGLAAAAFSRTAGVQMTNLVKGGIDTLDEMRVAYKNLGITIDEDLLRNSEAAVDAMTDLSYVMKAELMRAATSLAPEFEKVARFFVDNRDDVDAMTERMVEFIKTDVAGYFSSIEWSEIHQGMQTAVNLISDLAAAGAGATSAMGYVFSGEWARDFGEFADNTLAGEGVKFLFGGGLGEALEGVVSKFHDLGNEGEASLHKIPWEKTNEEIKTTDDYLDEINKKFPETVGAATKATDKINDANDSIQKTGIELMDLGNGVIGYYDTTAKAVEKVGESIEKAIPTDKMMEIKLQGDIDKDLAKIKADADIVQTAMEWEASLKIANIEAETAKIKAAFESIGETMTASTGAIADLFSLLGSGDLDIAEKWHLEEAIDRQLEVQERALEMQEKLVNAQVALLELRRKAMESGEPLIKITGDGLKPHLEAFMWEIIEEVQIRITEEGLDSLLT